MPDEQHRRIDSNMGIIGTTGWDPAGLSMWGIVTRLARLNYLNLTDTRRLFGVDELTSFRTDAERDPDVVTNFDLISISDTFGVDPDRFRSSFSDWYAHPWTPEQYRKAYCHHRLRICEACLANGEHLVVHQFVSWLRCPIHISPLTTQCPRCEGELPAYKIWTPRETGIGECQCEYQFLSCNSTNHEAQSRRLGFVRSFKHWLDRLEKLHEDESIHWLTGPKASLNLAHLHKIMPGPNWVAECLDLAPKTRLSSWTWKGRRLIFGHEYRTHHLPPEPLRIRRHVPPSVNSTTPKLVHEFERLLKQEIQTFAVMLWTKFDLSRDRCSVFEPNANECAVQYGPKVRVWNLAYWLWRRHVDEAFPWKVRLSRHRDVYPFECSDIWQTWRRIVGHLLWSPFRSLKQPRNVDFAKWFTKRWLRHYCEETFVGFAGVASRMIGANWMNSDALSIYLRYVIHRPLWSLKQHPNGTSRIQVVSTVSPIEKAIKLSQKGFAGCDEHFLDSFHRLEPLIKLLNPSVALQDEWIEHWNFVRENSIRLESLKTYPIGDKA